MRVTAVATAQRASLSRIRHPRFPWIGLVAAAGACALGRDLWLRNGAHGHAELLFYSVVATAGIPALHAQWAMYERKDRLALLPLPISTTGHLRDAARITAAKICPLLLALIGLAAGPALGGRPVVESAHDVGQVIVSFAAATLASFALAALAGRAAMRSGSPSWVRLRGAISGGWSAPEHAPFFWAPGLSVAVAALTTTGVQSGPGSAIVILALAAAVAVCSRTWFGSALFQVGPLWAEHARSIFGGRIPPPPSPVGLALGAVLPRAARPFFVRDATQLGRIYRGRGVLQGLGIAALWICALRTTSATWVTAASVVLVGALAFSAIRLTRPDASPPWLERTLPATGLARAAGRAAAVAVAPTFTGLGLGLGLYAGGGRTVAAAFVPLAAPILALAATLLARLGPVAGWTYAMLVGGAATAVWLTG